MKSAKTLAKELLPRLPSAYEEAASLILNSNGRYVDIAKVWLPALLGSSDLRAMVVLATLANGLWGVQAYRDALPALDQALAHPGDEVLSRQSPPWEGEPFTRERERALHRLYRYECLLALGEVDAPIPDATALPTPFKLSLSILEWGDPRDFVLRARIRAARHLRREGKRDLAERLIARCLPELDASLSRFAPYTPGNVPDLTVAEKRALQDFRAEGYAEAGLLRNDPRLLATAHWILAILHYGLRFGVEPEYAEAIHARAPVPALNSSE